MALVHPRPAFILLPVVMCPPLSMFSAPGPGGEHRPESRFGAPSIQSATWKILSRRLSRKKERYGCVYSQWCMCCENVCMSIERLISALIHSLQLSWVCVLRVGKGLADWNKYVSTWHIVNGNFGGKLFNDLNFEKRPKRVLRKPHILRLIRRRCGERVSLVYSTKFRRQQFNKKIQNTRDIWITVEFR